MDRGNTNKGLGNSCILVIVVAGVERFAFKGVASNLVTYLTDVVKLSNSSAAKTVNTWCGVTFMLPLLGAFLADTFFDRYSTILASSVLYVLGLVALTSTAFAWESIPSSKASCSFLLLSLFTISLGQGGYNPCLQAFGADQLDNNEELPPSKEDQISDAKKSAFFKWWYFGICTGSLLGVSCMAYLQDTFGWGLGFAIPTIAMVISVLPFSCGNRCYRHKEPKGGRNKSIKDLIQAIKATLSKMINGKITLAAKEVAELDPLLFRGRPCYRKVSNANIYNRLEEKPLCSQKFEYTKSLTEESNHNVASDAKAILRLLPIWTMLLMFAIIFQQPATFFTKQGMTMKRNIGKEFLIPPASLQIAINISIILLMPLYDKIVIPILRIITRDDKGINDVMQRMGIGMFLSIIAMIIAAFVETKRLEISRRSDLPLSIFWLLPQYIILGISDVFTVVGMQEFFYTEVPNNMKTVGMALHLSVFGVGSFLSALLISVIEFVTSDKDGRHCWFSDDMNEAHLDLYYWFLGLLSAISLMLFVHFCKNYIGKVAALNQNCK